MNKSGFVRKVLGIGLAVTGTVGSLAERAYSNIVIRTVPREAEWNREETGRKYALDVWLDTTDSDVSGKQIISTEWDVVVPEGLGINEGDAFLPWEAGAQNFNGDFYEGWSPGNMAHDDVDSTLDGSRELTYNNRMTSDFTGPTNRNRPLGTYWFSVDSDAALGSKSFGLNEVRIIDSEMNPYSPENGNVSVENGVFEIVPEPAMLGILAFGLLAVTSSSRRKSQSF